MGVILESWCAREGRIRFAAYAAAAVQVSHHPGALPPPAEGRRLGSQTQTVTCSVRFAQQATLSRSYAALP